MADRRRYYLTTSIAYANNKPGLHTLYEVIAADAIARWHRMLGDDTRFLTGTDEHSINIAQAAVDEGRPTREFVDEKVVLFKDGRGGPGDRARPVHPDDRPGPRPRRPRRWSGGRTPTATSTSARTRAGTARTRASATATDVVETARGTICPNHPEVPLQWLTERNWFFRLSAYQERLERHFADHPDFVQPDFRRNEMLGFIRGGLEDFSISRERTPGDWGIPFPIAEDGDVGRSARTARGIRPPARSTSGSTRSINYITGAGFPDDPAAFAHWWPADLHVIGKDIARFHTIFWPAMLWSAGLEAPRQVWVHGWLLAAGGERMSKSRGNFLDPNDFVAAFGSDGARYVALREVPFDRDAEVSWDSFVRRYNADLANDFGNLVNRTVSMAQRYLDGERPAPRPAGESPLGDGLGRDAAGLSRGVRGVPPPRRPGRAVGVRRRRQQGRRRRAAMGPRQGLEGRRRRRPGSGCAACSATSSRRAGWSVWRPRRSCPRTAPRLLAQLGHAYGYAPDGNGGPPILDELRWGAHAAEAGRLTAPEPLFPRLDVEAGDGRRLSPTTRAAPTRADRPMMPRCA